MLGFLHVLGKVLEENAEKVSQMGYSNGDIGTHSICKGAILYLVSLPGGPPAAATCIRAGWTMGKVKDVYIPYVTSSDQFVGRCLCLLSVLRSDFAVSPAHFVSKSFAWIASGRNLQFPMVRLIADYEKILNTCLASILFHRDWLLATLPVNHAFLMSTHVHRSESFDNKVELVHLTYPWSDINNAILGIPPHISLLQEVTFIQDQQQRMVGEFVSQLKDGWKRWELMAVGCRKTIFVPFYASFILHSYFKREHH
jgi:hypothetical protein